MRTDPKIVLVHGFNVSDKGKNTVDRLEPHLKNMFPKAQIDKDSTDYGRHLLWAVRFGYKDAVKRIADAIEHADVVITHSNGANYTHKALKLLSKENRNNPNLIIIHFSPALNRKQKLEQMVFKKIHVFCSKADKIVWIAKFLFLHAWGNAGQKGFITEDCRYTQTQYKRFKHSDWFKEKYIRYIVNKIGIFIGENI